MTPVGRILGIGSPAEFEQTALEIFRLQAAACEPYREYLDLIGVKPEDVRSACEIPHLPIELFKSRRVYCGKNAPEKVFTSSTTSGGEPSKHCMESLAWYRSFFRASFRHFYGEPESYAFYALLPCYLERGGSSLVFMADDFIRSGGGGFFLDDCEGLVRKLAAEKKPAILLGVSYALWDLAERYAPDLHGVTVMETGGMKGRREELPRERFHKLLCDAFRTERIHSEYGMAELTSQAYSTGYGLFGAPPWMRITVRDVNDPFTLLPEGHRGGINITDLGNLHSCAFIQTQDLGCIMPGGGFRILGRIEGSETRGCNLLVQ